MHRKVPLLCGFALIGIGDPTVSHQNKMGLKPWGGIGLGTAFGKGLQVEKAWCVQITESWEGGDSHGPGHKVPGFGGGIACQTG